MSEKSSYLQYLPPVLWQGEPDLPEFSLGAFLRIFEKVLTGIDDGVAVTHDGHTHASIGTVISGLSDLVDPWRTPPEFLPWLASWVGLEFPTLSGQPLWDAYQQRKATADIAGIDRLRGLRNGLNRYLDLFSIGPARPRVAVDDGRRLLITAPAAGTLAPMSAFVSQGPVVSGTTILAEGLVRPWAVTPAPGGGVFVADIGVPTSVPIPLKNRVWRIDPAGHHDVSGTPPLPVPLAPGTLPLNRVTALAVRPALGSLPETLYIQDRSGQLYGLPSPYLGASASVLTNLVAGASTFWPVAMAIDTNGDVLVLDRGDGPGTANPPKVITVRPGTSPVQVTRKNLTTVLEPLALLVRPDGRLVVGDGGVQQPTGVPVPAGNLVLVDRSAATWTETPLLPAANPLVAPTGLVLAGTRLYVLDNGLKPFAPPTIDPFVLAAAEPARVYAVDLAASPPTIAAATEPGQLVYPTGMCALGDRLVIADPGQPEVTGLVSVLSRVLPYRFDVVVHFTDSRLPTDPAARGVMQRQVVGNIRSIVEQQKPAHALWNLVTEI
ncbi:phage tail protein [Dactylosporangium sp. NPDC049140]|uniref:phage tail protein n=1 Tax=Dactylosporangium sp. NPDC049140 TaxID=3155647 RepID=UPI0033EC6795